jgi:hypothetical protein
VSWNRESRGGGRGSAALPPQALRASVSIGRLRMRLPVAAKMAVSMNVSQPARSYWREGSSAGLTYLVSVGPCPVM